MCRTVPVDLRWLCLGHSGGAGWAGRYVAVAVAVLHPACGCWCGLQLSQSLVFAFAQHVVEELVDVAAFQQRLFAVTEGWRDGMTMGGGGGGRSGGGVKG